MRISFNTNTSFKRQLKPGEEVQYAEVLQRAKGKLGNTGMSMLIVPSSSLSQTMNTNTGAGSITNEESKPFFEFIKKYWGINTIQLISEGQYTPSRNIRPYSGSALELGNHLISLEKLTKKEYANLISKQDFESVIQSNNSSVKDTVINFENVIFPDSASEKILRKAFSNLTKADTEEKLKMIEELNSFKEANKEWLEPLAKVRGDADFNNFKQFIADKQLSETRKYLNSKGIKLSGDMIFGFSHDEVKAYPEAFIWGKHNGFGLPALDLSKDEGIELLKLKTRLYAKRYDKIRLDMAWAYSLQPLCNHGEDIPSERLEYHDKILRIIEDEIQKVKGKNFHNDDITYEFIFGPNDYNLNRPEVKDRIAIQCSNYLNKNNGSTDAYIRKGWEEGSYILGATNHDCQLMKTQFANPSDREAQTQILSKILKIPAEKIKSLKEFIKAKFAEPLRGKHNMIFFADALNLDKEYKTCPMEIDNCRTKIPSNWEKLYFKSLESGEGYNPMDALEKAFISKGLDKKEPELFKKIVKYKKLLESPESKKSGKKLYAISALVCTALVAIYLIIKNGKEHIKENN